MRLLTSRMLVGVTAAVVALCAPGISYGATVGVASSALSYVASPGEANNVEITVVNHGDPGEFWILKDTGATLTAAAGCTMIDPNDWAYNYGTVQCPVPTSVSADLGDGNDLFGLDNRFISAPAVVDGGSGDDSLGGGAGNDHLIGGSGGDTLNGGLGGDTIDAGTGDDSIDGGACQGSPCPADGADTYHGGEGTDTVSYWARDGNLSVSLDGVANDGEAGENDNVAADVENVIGGQGDDTLTGNNGPNVLDGGNDYHGGDDTITGNGGNDFLFGGNGGADHIYGGAGGDVLFGGLGGGSDVLDGGTGDDLLSRAYGGILYPATLEGGDGIDTMDYSNSFDPVTVTLDGIANDGKVGVGDDVLDVENVTGSLYDDVIVGDSGANVIHGGGGSDTLDGGLGADEIHGDDGVDVVTYAARSADVSVSLDGVANDGEAGETDNIETDVENVTGGSGNDTFAGSTGPNRFAGGGGTDTVSYAARGEDLSVSLDGTANDGAAGEGDDIETDVEAILGGTGDDSLTGSAATNFLFGDDGDDTLDGGLGTDTLDGGAGTNTAAYGSHVNGVVVTLDGVANDGYAGENDLLVNIQNLTGGPGADTLAGDAGPNVLDGGVGADVLHGGDGADTASYASRVLAVRVTIDGVADDGQAGETDNVEADVENVTGGSGADALTGNGAANTLSGGAGNDILDGGLGTDVLHGGEGIDWASYSTRAVPLALSLDGVADDGATGENDEIGSDVEGLIGGSAADVLAGGSGDDFLDGGGGPDTFTGGAGSDWVVYSSRTVPIRVSLDGVADDGAKKEQDNVGIGVENIMGGAGNDSLTGNASANTIVGGPGKDKVFGLAGQDVLDVTDGKSHNDKADGGVDVDSCYGDLKDSLKHCE